MIAGLDSAFPPSAAAVKAAMAAGVELWGGYLASKPNVGLYNPWAQADFEGVRACGSTPIAYCSGWDDPAACKALAAAWDVRLCLDVEGGIRPDDHWVQGWLGASGAGLYGLPAVHVNRTAAFHVVSLWPGSDPSATWPSYLAKPNAPCGWQWQGGHAEFGVNVDRCWFDDSFAGLHGGGAGGLDMANADQIYTELRGDGQFSKLDMIVGVSGKGGGQLDRIETALKAIPGGAQSTVDLSAVLKAIGDLTVAQAAMAGDLATVKRLIEKDLAP